MSISIQLFIAGDVVPHRRTMELFRQKKTELLLGEIIPFIRQADLSIVNFESPIVNDSQVKPLKKFGPSLKTSIETMKVLKEAGFNVFTLANNHFRDYGQQGVADTINAAKELGIETIGGGTSIEEAKKVLLKEIHGKKIAILNACEHEFSTATDKYGGSNGLDIISMDKDIISARREADYVILILHGGREYYQLPTPRMKRWYQHFIEIGADAVINHHQHCFSGYELYQGKPIFYGLGNFCFDSAKKQHKSVWNFGYAVILILEDNIKFDLIPYEQCAEEPVVKLCDKSKFEEEINQLNTIIKDDDKLNNAFDTFVLSQEKVLLGSFLPFGRITMGLYRRNLLGKIYKKNHLTRFHNRIVCETHIETLQRLLQILNS